MSTFQFDYQFLLLDSTSLFLYFCFLNYFWIILLETPGLNSGDQYLWQCWSNQTLRRTMFSSFVLVISFLVNWVFLSLLKGRTSRSLWKRTRYYIYYWFMCPSKLFLNSCSLWITAAIQRQVWVCFFIICSFCKI